MKVLGYFDQYTPKDIDIYSPVDVIEYKCPSIVQKFALSYDALNILKKRNLKLYINKVYGCSIHFIHQNIKRKSLIAKL